MKKVILSVGFMFCAVLGMFAQEAETSTPNPINPNVAKYAFETEVLDYGKVDYASDGTREFKFTNVGKEPLIISNAKGSCGCTVPSAPKEPIMPGEEGVIKVKYDTKRPGSFTKRVTLTSNAETSTKVLTIKGVVGPKPTPAAPATPAAE